MTPSPNRNRQIPVRLLLQGWLLAGVLLVAGCAGPTNVPVVERTQPPGKKINHHWVSEDDTLYGIAWRYNLDVNRLAGLNRLELGDKIFVGQKLRLDVENLRSSAYRSTKNKANRKLVLPDQQRITSKWYWPTEGKITRGFSFANNAGHKGIDIKANRGQSVHASQEGVVVYAGKGLPAYGNLLIVKHADNYLSAYAHNSKLMVGEGATVKVGQKIAEVGRTGTTHDHLYFEIRKYGKPVNPMRFLKTAQS